MDSILIDEARTPLIISGPAEESTDKYYKIDRIVPRLRRDIDFQVDEKARTVNLTEEGVEKAEKLLAVGNLFEPQNMDWVHHIYQALKAHLLFKRDVDYMVKDEEVVIVDEFTGRLMPGRRYSDGLHQALEAKENVKIERENQTLATITFQNYFRMYKKLAGMTGTAETEAEEFFKIYKLEVNVIPPNRTLIRTEHSDIIYRTEREKYNAVVEEIKELHEEGRPVLVGTISIEKSEKLSTLLKRSGVPHVVLNAKYHAKEAEIVAQAGRKKAVTIATNMAGRGTDILLGGNPEFLTLQTPARKEPRPRDSIPKEEYDRIREHWLSVCQKEHDDVVKRGGLHILGTERHEARRIDNQLRGRAGRQGDPGSSRFYLSLEDDLMRIFASDRISGIMQSLGMEEGVPIESKLITRQIERAQKQVEARNFEIRKHLLEYDDVMNKQREAIYAIRRELLEGADQKEYIVDLAKDILMELIDATRAERQAPGSVGSGCLAHQRRQPVWHRHHRSGFRLSRKRLMTNLAEKLKGTVKRNYEDKEKRGRSGIHAISGTHDHAPGARHAVERPSSCARPPEGRDRLARVRATGSADRVQERKLRNVRGAQCPEGRGDNPLPLSLSAHQCGRPPGTRPAAGGSAPQDRPGSRIWSTAQVVTAPCSSASAKSPRSGGTIPAHAAAARSSRNVTVK